MLHEAEEPFFSSTYPFKKTQSNGEYKRMTRQGDESKTCTLERN